MASGGSGSGGTGGGGGGGGGSATDTTTSTTTVSGGTPCVQVNSLSPTADQSFSTDGVTLAAYYTVSRCGGNNTSFTVLLTGDDTAGNRVLSAQDTWYPNKNLPFSGFHGTEGASFATTYRVTLTIVVPETGAVLTTSTRSVTSPAARIATCAGVTNLGGTAGYYPGITTAGAMWLSYTVKNCGASDAFDVDFRITNTDTGQLVADFPRYAELAGGTTTGVGLQDVEPVPTGTNYEVRVEVHHHSDGSLLDTRSIALLTPVAK